VPEFLCSLDESEPNEPYNKVEIVTLPEIKLIGIERRFRAPEQSFEVFDRLYDDVFKNAPNKVFPNSRNATHVLSIIQPNGDFTIFSGIEVTSFDDVPKNADRYILPEQEHAMLWLNDDDGVDYRGAMDFLYLKWLSNNMNEFQSGQTEAYPIASVEYFVPSELCTQTNPQTEAVYIPINPVVATKETLESRRVYSVKDRPCKEEVIQKMIERITNDCVIRQESFEIILTANENSCEVMWVTDAVISHSELNEKIFEGGEFLKVETCNRCPHIAQSVFMKILEQSDFTFDNLFEIYYISESGLLTLTPMSLLARNIVI
jgi:predicted transcriptional regulator YdeE